MKFVLNKLVKCYMKYILLYFIYADMNIEKNI